MRRVSCPEAMQLPPTISVLPARSQSSDHIVEEEASLQSSNSISDPVLGHRLDVPRTRSQSDSEKETWPRRTHSLERDHTKHKTSLGKQFYNFKPSDDTIHEDTVLQNVTERSPTLLCALHDIGSGLSASRRAASTPNISQQFAHHMTYRQQSPYRSPRKGSEPCWSGALEPDRGMVGQMKRYSIQINHTLESMALRLLGDQREFPKRCFCFDQVSIAIALIVISYCSIFIVNTCHALVSISFKVYKLYVLSCSSLDRSAFSDFENKTNRSNYSTEYAA